MNPYRTVFLAPVMEGKTKVVGWRWTVTDDGRPVESGVEPTINRAGVCGHQRLKELYEEPQQVPGKSMGYDIAVAIWGVWERLCDYLLRSKAKWRSR